MTRLLWLLCVLGAALAPRLYAAEITGISVEQDANITRILLTTTVAAPAYRTFTLDGPPRFVVDVDDVRLRKGASADKLRFVESPVRGVRTGIRDGTGLRIVVDLERLAPARAVTFGAAERPGRGLVIEIEAAGKAGDPVPAPVTARESKRVESTPREEKSLLPSATETAAVSGNDIERLEVAAVEALAAAGTGRKVAVAIDAGHGGKDPGAIGPGGLREKDVVLAIARELAALLDAESGYRAIRVRNDDRFLPLRSRSRNAREAGADYFVSIHADAAPRIGARGASVYTLSARGATSEAARVLAEKENQSDLIGGVNLADKDDVLAGVLVDLSMTQMIAGSVELADSVLASLGEVTTVHARGVEQAAFMVLRSPDVPSILVEVGYISNPGEAKRLATRDHQRKLAKALLRGIDSHVRQHPPSGTLIASQPRRPPTRYTVVRGDSLSVLAQRFGVSRKALREANRMKSDRLLVGQRLAIPTRSGAGG